MRMLVALALVQMQSSLFLAHSLMFSVSTLDATIRIVTVSDCTARIMGSAQSPALRNGQLLTRSYPTRLAMQKLVMPGGTG